MKKHFKKISTILSFILIISFTSSLVYADTTNAPTFFNGLAEDTVIMNIDGEDITIADLSNDNTVVVNDVKYFFTPNEKIDRSLLNDTVMENDNPTPFVMDPGHDSGSGSVLQPLPSGKTTALVQRKLVTTRYSQQSDVYYLTAKKGAEFAAELASGTYISIIANTCLGIALGSASQQYYGVIYAVGSMFGALANKAFADQILSYTKQNYKVRITSCKSPYGTLKSVTRWGSNAIDIGCINNSTTTETIYNKVFN